MLYKVDVIRPGSLNQIIGPVGTLKRIIKNKEYFEGRGYDFTIFTHDIFSKRECGVSVARNHHKKGIIKKIKSKTRLYARYSFVLSYLFDLRSQLHTKKLVKYYLSLNRDPDFIVFHSPVECYQYLKYSKNKRAKVIMFQHTDGIPYRMQLEYYPKFKETSYLKGKMEKLSWTARNTDHLVFIAKIGQINFLKAFAFLDIKKTSVILNGIDDFTLSQKNEINEIKSKTFKFKYRLCCSGTINQRKGHRIIIEALRGLDENLLRDIHVSFLGEGAERIELENLVHKYGLQDHVTFEGFVPNEQVYKYLAASNIYILMSKNEGLPISIIEAMRAGLPVISTKLSGIPELVDKTNGILVNPDTEELKMVFNNMSRYNWSEMGYCSRVRFENEFTFERMEKEYCDMLDSMVLPSNK